MPYLIDLTIRGQNVFMSQCIFICQEGVVNNKAILVKQSKTKVHLYSLNIVHTNLYIIYVGFNISSYFYYS